MRLTRLTISLSTMYLLLANITLAQEFDDSIWSGHWVGDGTIFEIRVEVENGVMKVHQIESMGFTWNSKDGTVEGNIARVEVEYAGVIGIIQAELVDSETAVAFAATCVPDFMVVCVLAKDRQAVFKKVLND
ncbi:MAG: hypothetical protein OXU66_01890 [Gammaproteobacteria bacterium]|nr:hypothetical protein [Gammaproteobacteria bacterium]MDD9894348.1 hypothetical protein [Gammaproteobacteria bacterium]MDD9957668.1 hypothetical protein [Gammaproteobacteria bacterium]